MESTRFVGLHAHKNSIVATVVDQEGNQLDPTRLGLGDTELQELFEHWRVPDFLRRVGIPQWLATC